MGRRRWCAFGVALALTLVATPGASGATRIGPADMTTHDLPGFGCSSSCVYVETDPGLKVPFNGVIVRWRVYAQNPGNPRLRIIRRAASNVTVVGDSAAAPVVTGLNTQSTTIPVRKGDLLAFEFGGVGIATRSPRANKGLYWTSGLLDGTTQSEGTATSAVEPGELLLNADIERDNDLDGLGDETQDGDDDNDGHADTADNCPLVANDDQRNTDDDAHGDACDSDDDNDAVPDAAETAQGTDPLKQDSDIDGARDDRDNCPATANRNQRDSDHDGLGNACDSDDDNDGLSDAVEALPRPKVKLRGVPKAIKRAKLARKGLRVRIGADQPVALAVELRAGRAVLAEATAGQSSRLRRFKLKGRTGARKVTLVVRATNPAGKQRGVRRRIRVR
jgi:hypothetical protein